MPAYPAPYSVVTDDVPRAHLYQPAKVNPRGQRLRSGTGFFVSGNGVFVTSAHVVDRCRRVMIWPRGSGPFIGEIVALDRGTDIALLSTDQHTSRYASLMRTQPPSIGARTSTLGYGVVVSEPKKPIINRGTFIGTAATSIGKRLLVIRSDLHEGNSGAPVIDDQDAVIGMVIGRATDQPDHGLAVPGSEISAILSNAGILSTAEPAGNGPRVRPSDFLISISALVQCESEIAIDYVPRLELTPDFVEPSSRPLGWIGWFFGYGR